VRGADRRPCAGTRAMIGEAPHDPIALTPEEERRRRIRSIAIGWGLGALALLFFLVTLVRLGGDIANRAL
ncbi:MAG TPA: hypothetical protein VH858_05360, partial [Hyphomicrobiales bacterium]